MKYFYRTKKDNTFLGFFALVFALFLSMLFMLIGFIGFDKTDPEVGFNIIFGIAGIALFVIFCRGAWMMASGSLTHVLSMDEEEFVWGFIGNEKSIAIEQIKEIDWIEMDGLYVKIITKDNRKISLNYIENVLSLKSRKAFLDYVQLNHPEIKIKRN